jgi:hypothetical protein
MPGGKAEAMPHERQTAIGIGAGIFSSAFCISRQRRRRASFFFRNLP